MELRGELLVQLGHLILKRQNILIFNVRFLYFSSSHQPSKVTI